jgi:PRTRC genetic system protein E
VNIVPKKLKDGDNDALTTPLSVTGTAEDLDAELSTTIISFVGSHLQMKNTLEKAKAEMDAASKAAQAEARAKSKLTAKQIPPKTEVTQPATEVKQAEPAKPEPPKTASLFDYPVPLETPMAVPVESKEATDSFAQFAEIDDDEESEESEESEELDEVA